MVDKRRIVFTSGIRSEFHIQRPVLEAMMAHPRLTARLIVTGAHLAAGYGDGFLEMENMNLPIAAKLPNLVDSDRPSARVAGLATQLTALVPVIEAERPDLLVAPYDREEAMTVALAGVYTGIPVAHLGAGDRTRVNVDGIVRQAVSKLAHIHFCATEENRQRLLKMGEEPWRVFTVGHTGLDRYRRIPAMALKELEARLGLDIGAEPLVVMVQHPVSETATAGREQIRATLAAIDALDRPTVIIHPNSDPGRGAMVTELEGFRFGNRRVRMFPNLPEETFVNLMRRASVLVGNSSMGVLEAPLLNLPVVNVGERQKDRQNAGNILFVPHETGAILAAMRRCLGDESFRERVARAENPYGTGDAALKIADVLAGIELSPALLSKRMVY